MMTNLIRLEVDFERNYGSELGIDKKLPFYSTFLLISSSLPIAGVGELIIEITGS